MAQVSMQLPRSNADEMVHEGVTDGKPSLEKDGIDVLGTRKTTSDSTRSDSSQEPVPLRCSSSTRRKMRVVSASLLVATLVAAKLKDAWLLDSRVLHDYAEVEGGGWSPGARIAFPDYLMGIHSLSDSGGLSNCRLKNHSGGDRPVLYLHVGLPKTGTTFLQCSLCHNANATDPILRSDNLVYLGTCPSSDCGMRVHDERFMVHSPASFFPHGSTKEPAANPIGPVLHNDTSRLRQYLPLDIDTQPLPRFAKSLVRRLQEVRDANLDAFIIFEGSHVFSHRHIQALSELLQVQQNWTVEVLVAYRPLYQWLPSKYNSINKPARNRAARVWPNQTSETGVLGAPLLPFALEDRGPFSELVRDVEYYLQHPAETVQHNFRRYFDRVRVLPLQTLDQWQKRASINKLKTGCDDNNETKGVSRHGRSAVVTSVDPLLEYLFCEVLQKTNVCNAVRRGAISSSVPLNPSVALDYDLLSVAAYERNLFHVQDIDHRTMRRERVSRLVQRRQEHDLGLTVHDFPRQCLPDHVLERLEKLSLRLEQQLFVSDWAKEQEDFHHNGFSAYRPNYCWVDVDKVLQDEEWRGFFAALGDTD